LFWRGVAAIAAADYLPLVPRTLEITARGRSLSCHMPGNRRVMAFRWGSPGGPGGRRDGRFGPLSRRL